MRVCAQAQLADIAVTGVAVEIFFEIFMAFCGAGFNNLPVFEVHGDVFDHFGLIMMGRKISLGDDGAINTITARGAEDF